MRILLIRPPNGGNINTRLPESLNRRQGELPPLGIAYIAAVLEEAGHAVKILDCCALNLRESELAREAADFKPELAGITAMSSTLWGALAAARAAKEAGAVTVLGGPQLSAYPRETLSHRCVDFGVNGEGEAVMAELARALEKKDRVDAIRGLIFRKEGAVCVNAPAVAEDIDSLPFPAYHLLPMKRYDSIIGRSPVSTMISSRGCPYQCSFCFKQPADMRVRFRSPRKVVDEMAYLAEKFGIREVMFYDDAMMSNRGHVAGICEEILRRGLKIAWETPGRVDNVDRPLLELMRRAGCIRLRYGVESGDENILGLMNKKIDLGRVREAFRSTKDAGIETFAYFMIGYAHETEETMRATIDFAVALDPDLVMFTVATPYPGTPLYELAMREKVIENDYWRDFTLGAQNARRIPYFRDDAGAWVRRAYLHFYFRPGYAVRKLKSIRSWGELSKCLKAARGIACMSQ